MTAKPDGEEVMDMLENWLPLKHAKIWETPRFLILTNRPERRKLLIKALRAEGIYHCRTAKTLAHAVALHCQMPASCVIFDRAYAPQWEGLFDSFHDSSIYFVPVADVLNNMDAIDGLNTHRLSNYLVEPLTEHAISQTVSLLRERMWMDRHLRGRRIPLERPDLKKRWEQT